jgi:hypothetical protein
MTVEQLMALVRARIVYLGSLRTAAERLGDSSELARLDAELAECQSTLSTLLAV